MKTNNLLLATLTIILSVPVFGQTNDDKYVEDVKSINSIIDAYYEVVSGTSQDPWQFERDKYIHSENALITKLKDDGKAESHTLEAEYIPMLLSPREDFYEKELKRKISHFGNIAHVWSAFEVRTKPNISSNIRGLTSIQLHFAEGRWFIDSWITEMESDNTSLLTDFLKRE